MCLQFFTLTTKAILVHYNAENTQFLQQKTFRYMREYVHNVSENVVLYYNILYVDKYTYLLLN